MMNEAKPAALLEAQAALARFLHSRTDAVMSNASVAEVARVGAQTKTALDLL